MEAISGPGATQWGANAVNGAIEISTTSARDTQGSLLKGGTDADLRAAGGRRHGGTPASGLYYRVYGKYIEGRVGEGRYFFLQPARRERRSTGHSGWGEPGRTLKKNLDWV